MSLHSKYLVELWLAALSPIVQVSPHRTTKVGVRLGDIVDGLNPQVVKRSRKCSVVTKRSDPNHLRWIMSVDCGNGPKVVRMKALRDKAITKLEKMDLKLSCSCQFTRWQGPEHHSKREEYLDGKPRGTASVPIIKDPTGINRVCKHMYATLLHIQNWSIEKKK